MGDARERGTAGRRLHRQIRQQMRATVLRQRVSLSLLAVVSTVAVAYWVWITSTGVIPPFVGGVAVGGTVIGVAASAYWIVEFVSGTHNARFGVAGEELTFGLFRTRRMRALGWVVFDGVPFAGLGDIDHIAIGPTGVLAVEGKWTNCDWLLEHGKLRGPVGDPVGQAWRNADRLGRFLASRDVSVHVTPILVVWGPGCGWDQDNEWINGVLLLKGSAVTHITELLDGLTVEPLDQSSLENALRAVTGYVSGHPDHSSDQPSVRASAFRRAS